MLSANAQHLAFQHGMTILELRFRAKAGAARNAYIRQSAKVYAETGHPPAFLGANHKLRLQQALQAHYDATGAYFGRLALQAIREGKKAALTPIQVLMHSWVQREALRKAQMIADTDRVDITDAIAQGIEDGLGTAEIATSIRQLTGFTPYRSALIARTETHAAATYGSIASVRDAEQQLETQMLKQWLPTSDTRTRPEHLAMRGQPPIPLADKFLVGGESMDRPGDSAASAHNLINCRCSLTYQEAE